MFTAFGYSVHKNGLQLLLKRGQLLIWICLLVIVSAQAFGSVKIFIKPNPEDGSMRDVYVKDYSTGKATKYATVYNRFNRHLTKEYRNGYLYIVQERIVPNNDPSMSSVHWDHDLWKYDKNGKGTKLLTANRIDFRISEDGKLIAAVATNFRYNPSHIDGNILHLLKADGTSVETFREDRFWLKGYLQLEKWAGRYLWLKDQKSIDIYGFIRIDTHNMATKKYRVAIQDNKYDLNTSSLLLAYDNYPVTYETSDAEKFKKSKATVKLYVYDLAKKKRSTLDKSIIEKFEPKWIGPKTLEYNNPRGTGRLVKRI